MDRRTLKTDNPDSRLRQQRRSDANAWSLAAAGRAVGLEQGQFYPLHAGQGQGHARTLDEDGAQIPAVDIQHPNASDQVKIFSIACRIIGLSMIPSLIVAFIYGESKVWCRRFHERIERKCCRSWTKMEIKEAC